MSRTPPICESEFKQSEFKSQLSVSNVADNGIGQEGAMAIGEALKVNHAVTSIDLNGMNSL